MAQEYTQTHGAREVLQVRTLPPMNTEVVVAASTAHFRLVFPHGGSADYPHHECVFQQ
jgi:hypothetical protein